MFVVLHSGWHWRGSLSPYLSNLYWNLNDTVLRLKGFTRRKHSYHLVFKLSQIRRESKPSNALPSYFIIYFFSCQVSGLAHSQLMYRLVTKPGLCSELVICGWVSFKTCKVGIMLGVQEYCNIVTLSPQHSPVPHISPDADSHKI